MRANSSGRKFVGSKLRSFRGARVALRNAAFSQVERLEERRLLSAVVAPPDSVILGSAALSAPLPPQPGHSLYVSGNNSAGNAISTWANASAITPNITNDLVLNVMPFFTNYVAAFEGSGGTLGAALLTNGLTQSQTGPSPSPGAAALGDGGASDASSNTNTISDSAAPYFFSYQLGTANGQTPSTRGYDLTEVDLITGHQDTRTSIDPVDILVEPVGSSQFVSLSGGSGFSLIEVPDGKGGSTAILRGGAQMAIVNSGGPLATNIQAVELVVLDPSTWVREFVVTGTASGTPPPAAPVAPAVVSAALGAGGVTASWTTSVGATGYTLLRSTSAAGPYAAVASVAGQTSVVDPTATIGSTYFYEVIAAGNGDSAPSGPSAPFTVPSFGATEYLFKSQGWPGNPPISEALPLINYYGGQNSNLAVVPLASGINPNTFSALIEGKITTDLAGKYSFAVGTDDDGYLYLNGQLVSSNSGGHAEIISTANTPVVLAANTSYNFIFLENQRTANWAMKMYWSEPQAGGGAGPLTIVPATKLTLAVDLPAAPTNLSTSSTGATVQLTWTPSGDPSSLGYVIERASADALGNPIGSFAPVGQVFSGPAVGAVGAAAWGAISFSDTTVLLASSYVYEVGPITPNQAVPAVLSSPTSITTPSTGDSASLANGLLNVQVGPNDSATISLVGGKIAVSEGATTVFTADPTTVNALNVIGTVSIPGTATITGPLSFSGPITINQLSNLTLGGSISASALSGAASNNITINGPLTTSGAFSLSAANTIAVNATVTSHGAMSLAADSDANNAGNLVVAAGQSLNSNGSNISLHGSGMTVSGTVNAGAGNITYSLSPTFSISGLLPNAISSGVVTVTQTTDTGVAYSDFAGAGVTGSVVINFPAATLTTSGFNTSKGNANLRIAAATITDSGTFATGTGSLTLQATTATMNGPIFAGAVSLLGGSFTLKSPLQASGLLTVGGKLTLSSTSATLSSNMFLQNGATVSINSTSTSSGSITFEYSSSIFGQGQILFVGGSSSSPSILTGDPNFFTQLTITPGISISAATGSGVLGIGFYSNVFNQGQISVQAGRQITVNSFLDNSGTITLAGGALATQGVTNEGTISVTSGLLNAQYAQLYNYGVLTLSNASIVSQVVSYGTINITGGTTSFYNFFDQEAGSINVTNATVNFLADVYINGVYNSDPAINNFRGVLAIGEGGVLIGGAGDQFFVWGNYSNRSSQTSTWNTSAAELHLIGGNYHYLYLQGQPNDFPWGTLAIDAGDTAIVYGGGITVANTVNNGTIELSGGTSSFGSVSGSGNIVADVNVAVSSPITSAFLPYGATDVLTATVTPLAGGLPTPGGVVQFFDNGVPLGTAALDNSGRAYLVTSNLNLGLNYITASYLGAGIFLPGYSSNSLTQTAIAGALILDPASRGALSVSGNAKLDVSGAPIIVDSSNASAVTVSGNGTVSASAIDDAGGVSRSGNGHVGPATSHAPVADPLQSIDPLYGWYFNTQSTSQLVISKGQVTLYPGTYIGGIKITGGSVTLSPGYYFMQGGGFTVSGNASVTDAGQGVLIYNAPNSVKDTISFSGNAKVTLSPILYTEYQGMVIAQDRTSSAPISLSGNAKLQITGTIYAAAAALVVSGNAELDASFNPLDTIGASLIVDDLNLSGNANIQISDPTTDWQQLLAQWL